MTWFRRAWWDFFFWVAHWFAPPDPMRKPPKPLFDKSAHDLINLCRKIREQQKEMIDGQSRSRFLSVDEYQRLREEQMQAMPSIPTGIYRSTSLRHCMDAVERDRKAAMEAQRQPLTLKVQK